MKPSPEIEARLQSRYAQLRQADLQNKQVDTTFWGYLQESEELLIELMSGTPPGPTASGSMEWSWALYFLNNDAPADITNLLREIFDMPASQITPADWTEWEEELTGEGVLYGDGSLVSYVTYGVLDPGWSLALMDYLLFWMGIRSPYPFGTDQQTLTVTGQSSLRIALFGDWGTGNYTDGNLPKSPSQLITSSIDAANPDVSIHLGDVYYTGTADEEQNHLLDCWPTASKGNFMLNSNHEMYDGGIGYFGTSLQSPIFWNQQKGTSYFQIEFGNWVILGLDSAYYDTSWLFSDGAIIDEGQISLLKQAAASGKQIMLLSHHNPIDITGSIQGPLWQQVLDILSPTIPNYWYWGHQHNGVVYVPAVTGTIACRCLGNAGIPIGNASWLESNSNVTAYTNKPLADPTTQQMLRVMNGYAILTFSENSVTEEWFYQDGSPVTI